MANWTNFCCLRSTPNQLLTQNKSDIRIIVENVNEQPNLHFKNWKLLTFFHYSRYVWYCPGWRASQYKLFCPENVADLLHLGFIFNFPSDWVENGGSRRDTSKEKRGWRDFPVLENHQTYYSWNHAFECVMVGLWRAKWTFQNTITGNHQLLPFCHCHWTAFSTHHVVCLSLCI